MAPRTILLVDDDPLIRQALQTVLESNGYRVLAAADGVLGIEAAQREAPDLVIVDMMMPRKSGFLVAGHLKQSERPPKVIMITANEGSRHRAYAETLGVDEYLQKPFALEQLLGVVTRLAPLAS